MMTSGKTVFFEMSIVSCKFDIFKKAALERRIALFPGRFWQEFAIRGAHRIRYQF